MSMIIIVTDNEYFLKVMQQKKQQQKFNESKFQGLDGANEPKLGK